MADHNTWWNEDETVDARVEALLPEWTLEDKVNLVSGRLVVAHDRPDVAPPSPIPPFSLSDGPAGIHGAEQRIHGGKATALPAPIALAATWSPELARRYGEVLGAEARAHGHNVLLGPAVDLARAPLAGRTFESFGEDPLLQARMVVPEVEAIQGHAVQACLKHYIVNNQEYQRNSIDVRVDERALQEIYLPPFAAAVQQARAASVMGAYNRINGTFACENPHTLTMILRDQLLFRGWVMSDYMANQSTVASAKAGLDWELTMFGHWGERLLAAVEAGMVPLAVLDEMVRRILRPTVGLGLLEQPATPHPVPVAEHGAVARAVAEQGIVLLKNADGLLPLAADAIRSIAVIGPDADNVSAAGGGSALVPPVYGVSVLDGIRARAGGTHVEYAPGTDPVGAGALLPGPPAIPSAVLRPGGGTADEHGLRAEYWANPRFEGEPSVVRTDLQVDLNRGFFDLGPGLNASSPKALRVPADLPGSISIRWSGSLVVPTGCEYTLALTSLGSARLFLDGRLLIDTPHPAPAGTAGPPPPGRPVVGMAAGALRVATAAVRLEAGEPRAVVIEYVADAPEQSTAFKEAMIRFGWQPPGDTITSSIGEAVALARRSDTAVVVVRTFESEAMDRATLRLPNEQDVLIRAVAAANPRTIVVLMTGAAVETASWEAGVPAILEAWYAGQEQGSAVARVLFGDVNPAGRLPVTFPRSDDQIPLAAPAQYPGVDGAVEYSESIFVGYRGYEQLGIRPQYPFGYGLSYTTFAYSNLRLSSASLGVDETMTVSVDVTNTGERAGDEVVQLYVAHLDSSVQRPSQELKGFRRIHLGPGETQTVALRLAARDLAYWDTDQQRFVVENGRIEIRVGRSSADIQLQATLHVVSEGQ